MKTYKALAAGLALASLLTASVASAQTASSTSPVSGPDLLVAITSSGIVLDATHSSQPIVVKGLPFSIGAGTGGACNLMNGSINLGTIGTTGTGSVDFTTSNSVTVPAGSSVTLSVNCTGATAGNYPVTLATSLIPAIVANTNTSITPHGTDNTTTARGTLTINGGGSVGGITPGTGSGTGTGSSGGSVLGTTTGSNLPGSSSGSVSGSVTPGVPNTGDGGAMAVNLTILVLAALAAVGGTYALRRYAR